MPFADRADSLSGWKRRATLEACCYSKESLHLQYLIVCGSKQVMGITKNPEQKLQTCKIIFLGRAQHPEREPFCKQIGKCHHNPHKSGSCSTCVCIPISDNRDWKWACLYEYGWAAFRGRDCQCCSQFRARKPGKTTTYTEAPPQVLGNARILVLSAQVPHQRHMAWEIFPPNGMGTIVFRAR